jgi:hypothetical protein
MITIILLFICQVADSTKCNTIYKIDRLFSTESKWDSFIKQLILHETKELKDLIGDNGRAVGVLQMHPIMVDEINRITGKNFKYSDRWSREKSVEMFNLYQNHYNPQKDLELAARLWNAGPKALNKKHNYLTDSYVNKLLKINQNTY